MKNMEEKKIDPSQKANVLLNSLPKGAVPPSSPSNKGHAKLVTLKHYVGAYFDHNMESVPSPGIGN